MRVHTLIFGALVAAIGLPSPALACAPFLYESAIAEARIRGADGVWRPVQVEVEASRMRLEYDSTRSASGRVGMVFNVASNSALVFPAPGRHAPPRQAQVAVPMTLDAALAGLGLSRNVLARWGTGDAPLQRVGRLTCSAAWDFDLHKVDDSICVISTSVKDRHGLPAYVLDKTGRRIFEVTAVTYRAVPDARFRAPAGFRNAGREIRQFGCGG